jgi:hypothetical protein
MDGQESASGVTKRQADEAAMELYTTSLVSTSGGDYSKL